MDDLSPTKNISGVSKSEQPYVESFKKIVRTLQFNWLRIEEIKKTLNIGLSMSFLTIIVYQFYLAIQCIILITNPKRPEMK